MVIALLLIRGMKANDSDKNKVHPVACILKHAHVDRTPAVPQQTPGGQNSDKKAFWKSVIGHTEAVAIA